MVEPQEEKNIILYNMLTASTFKNHALHPFPSLFSSKWVKNQLPKYIWSGLGFFLTSPAGIFQLWQSLIEALLQQQQKNSDLIQFPVV